MRASIAPLGRRLPELADDLVAIDELVERDEPERVLESARSISSKALVLVCQEHGIKSDSKTVEQLLEVIVERHAMPASIAAHVRNIHEPGDPTAIRAGDATRSLVTFLEWQVGSRSSLSVQRPKPKVPTKPLWIAGMLLLAALVGSFIAVMVRAHTRPAAKPVLPESNMVHIPGATFEMGSHDDEVSDALAICGDIDHRSLDACKHELALLAREQPKPVRISAFELDRFEVTVDDFARWLQLTSAPVVAALPGVTYDPATKRYSAKPGQEKLPIVGVTWHAASAYCAALGKRLPTEAEWELAARGVARRRFPWGSEVPACTEVVYARGDGQVCERASAVYGDPVGSASRDVTPEGVHDLGGNVSEWTADAAGERPTCQGPCVDPRLDGLTTSQRVVRGGNWRGYTGWLRGAARGEEEPDSSRTSIGFRCARTLGVRQASPAS
ncbi:MAG TPA: formylglycine-generating enzyme family protein [Kofleriaceae bacterium]|nr:formylglycine-generating enzyme family protein [Kofleriaceae bacterium]